MSVTVTNASLLNLCNFKPHSSLIDLYLVFYTEKYVNLKSFTLL